MNVTYQDRHGKAWRFDVPATPYQTLLFLRVLRAVHNVGGGAETLSLSYLADAEANDAFLSAVEGVVLSALYDRFPPQPQEPQRTVEEQPTPRPAKLTAEAAADPDTDEHVERKTYYWENF